MPRVLLIGKSARVDCLAEALKMSQGQVELFCFSEVRSPGLVRKAAEIRLGRTDDVPQVVAYASETRPDFAVVGPEDALEAGVADALTAMGIPCFGPTKNLAQLESSKTFTRELLARHDIPGNPRFEVFRGADGIPDYLASLGEFVVKPDGLTGGKGVRVSGDHLASVSEGAEYAAALLAKHQAVVIEEKLVGEEFSLQAVVDGPHVVDSIPVQDHKRSQEGDAGPNTGGMGSYSSEDHRLPFLTSQDIAAASAINRSVGEALGREFPGPYHGVLYGGFIATRDGVKLIEYNVRFGDPEVNNVMPLLETDFVKVCENVFNSSLDSLSFARKATVCKYVVPEGYPESPVKDVEIRNVPEARDDLRVYYGAVNEEEGTGRKLLTGSRAIAFVGIGKDLAQAEAIAEEAAAAVEGPVRHRQDIGTQRLVGARVEHMKGLRASELEAT